MSNEQEKPIEESKMNNKLNKQQNEIEGEQYIPTTPVTTLSIISKVFYVFSVLTVIGLFPYLSGITLADVEIMSIQFLIICSYLTSAFIFFSFAELFESVNRIEKNTRK